MNTVPEYAHLSEHVSKNTPFDLRKLFHDDEGRFAKMHLSLFGGDLLLDYSKNLVTEETVLRFLFSFTFFSFFLSFFLSFSVCLSVFATKLKMKEILVSVIFLRFPFDHLILNSIVIHPLFHFQCQ